ncbi:MAG: peptidoglycan DD-metalloendopeptidase family protein [Saprospiraceae bacterium]|nr:peptidoglycan DD-metalloendopeptidase family protein [Saprospiraceae bacterium]
MRKIKVALCSLILMLFAGIASGQGAAPEAGYFDSPVDYSITLAGSFAELRQTHFHAGIDIKPKSKTGIDTIRAAADGYVSRIKVQTGGYGQALYIDHPNGYTTVYAHLDEYTDTLTQFIRNIQRKTESYPLDIYPDSTAFYFKKGQPIGLMGNTGRSYAKHLHFEIRETESEIPVNPAIFGLKPRDTRPPVVLSLDIHQISPDFHEHHSSTYYPAGLKDGSYTINNGSVTFPAWTCGISVQSYDLMNGASNRNGVFYQKTYVDDTLIHSFTLDKISFDESRYINSHVDYAQRTLNRRTLVRTFKLPGNQLSVYDSIKDNGLISLYQNKSRAVKIVLGDFDGNETEVKFNISRANEILPPETKPFNFKVLQGKADTISAWGSRVIFNPRSLDRDLYITVKKEEDGFLIGNNSTKLFSSVEISLPVDFQEADSLDQLGIWYQEEDKWINMGGVKEDGKITTRTSALGKFTLGYDTIPPTIKVYTKGSSIVPGKKIKGILDDNIQTGGMAEEVKYAAFLDGSWIVAAYKIMTREMEIDIPEDIPAGPHQLTIQAIDHHGNTSEKTIKFNIGN